MTQLTSEHFKIWHSTDAETTREVWNDIQSAISTCRNSDFHLLWIFTNCNVHVLRNINRQLEKAKQALDRISVKVEVFRVYTKEAEIKKRWECQNSKIPTLIVEIEVENKVILEI
jgi:hypothetical protein